MTVLIGGTAYAWSNLNNIAFGIPVLGITAINYDIDQVKENNYGTGIDPYNRGYGEKTYSGSITVFREWWQSVINAAPNKQPLDIAPFDWTIAYGNLGTPIITETLKAFEFTKDGMKGAQGDTKLLMDIPFIFAGIAR